MNQHKFRFFVKFSQNLSRLIVTNQFIANRLIIICHYADSDQSSRFRKDAQLVRRWLVKEEKRHLLAKVHQLSFRTDVRADVFFDCQRIARSNLEIIFFLAGSMLNWTAVHFLCYEYRLVHMMIKIQYFRWNKIKFFCLLPCLLFLTWNLLFLVWRY